jgi:hypothetical protein
MEHKIIKTENYLLVVSDEKIKEDDYALLDKKTHLEIQKALPSCLKNAFKNAECWNVENEVHEAGHKKIIAHLPLNGEPYLEGVDVLPEIENEVDLLEVFDMACDLLLEVMSKNPPPREEAILRTNKIKELNQPKLPIAFECEMMDYGQFDCGVFMKDGEEPKTVNTIRGTEWVGEYLF